MKNRFLTATCAGLVVGSTLFGCKPAEDYTDPGFLAWAIERGDERAFRSVGELPEEQRGELVLPLIEAYNANLRPGEAIDALIQTGSPEAERVYRSALERPDDRVSVRGARGLAALGMQEAAIPIANRATQATDQSMIPQYFESLLEIPSAEAADIVAPMLMRPYNVIGGVGTVEAGCKLVEAVEDPTDNAISAALFGMSNFDTNDVANPINVCELAVLEHMPDAVDQVIELYRGENDDVTEMLESKGLFAETGQLRGALLLYHTRTEEGRQALRGWLNSSHDIPQEDLARRSDDEQRIWYRDAGQLFQLSVQALGNYRNEADSALIRPLTTPTIGTEEYNFEAWKGLSVTAERNLRELSVDALVRIGDEEGRAAIWELAREGEMSRGGAQANGGFRINLLHFLGRTPQAGDFERFTDVVDAQEEFENQFEMLAGYFIAGEECGTNVDCWKQVLLGDKEFTDHEYAVGAMERAENDSMRTTIRRAISGGGEKAAIWTLASLAQTNPAAGAALGEGLAEASLSLRLSITDALMTLGELPPRAREVAEATLADPSSVRRMDNVSQYLHNLRVLLATR